MTKEDIKTGCCYSRGDDALYKVIATGEDWILTLHYSFNHCICMPWIFTYDDFCDDEMEEYTDNWHTDIFDELEYADYDMLKFSENY